MVLKGLANYFGWASILSSQGRTNGKRPSVWFSPSAKVRRCFVARGSLLGWVAQRSKLYALF